MAEWGKDPGEHLVCLLHFTSGDTEAPDGAQD